MLGLSAPTVGFRREIAGGEKGGSSRNYDRGFENAKSPGLNLERVFKRDYWFAIRRDIRLIMAI